MYQDSMTVDEWSTLQFAPLWVFGVIASIDGEIDDKEQAALAKELTEALLYKDVFVKEVLVSVGQNLKDVFKGYAMDSRSALKGLEDARKVLDIRAPDHAEHFARSMVLLGKKIAESSGAGVLRHRDPVSKEEKVGLVAVALALGIRP